LSHKFTKTLIFHDAIPVPT